jgi:hypothetical protein
MSLWSGAYAQTVSGAQVRLYTSAPPAGCPFGSDPNDGCLTAPANAQVQIANFFTGYANQSGQSLGAVASRNYNVAGVDYKIGPTITQAAALDPTTNTPAGCLICDPHSINSCSSFNPVNGYVLNCSGSAVTINGLNFGAVGGHGSGFIVCKSTCSGTLTITNNWFSRDSGCSAPVPIAFPGTGSFIVVQNGETANVVIRNNSIDGNDLGCRYAGFGGMGGVVLHTTGTVTVERNYIGHLSLRALSFDGVAGNADLVRWNLIDCFNTVPWAGHGEVGLYGNIPTGDSSQRYTIAVSYTTTNLCADMGALGTATWFPTNGGTLGGSFFTDFTFDHIIAVTNIVGGGSSAFTGSITTHIDDDPATGLHNRLTVDAISPGGTLRVGSRVIVSGVYDVYMMANLTGGIPGGLGSTWTVACGPDFNTCTGATPVHTSYGADIPGQTYPTHSVGVWQNNTTSVACIEAGSADYTTFHVTNSYCDITGANTNAYWAANADAVCGSSAVFTNNKDANGGAAKNAWTTNASASC